MGYRISTFLPFAAWALAGAIGVATWPHVATAVLADSTAASLSPALPLADDFHPNVEPNLMVRRAVGAIQVDGRLDEVAWRHAIRAGNFCQIEPPQAEPPEVGTEVLVTYDETRVYFAFKAWDDPRAVHVSDATRDSIQDDDWVGLLLDTFGDASWAYEVAFNACGVVSDGRWTAQGTDRSFDLVCEAKGRLTNDGYQVEVGIPFTSLRLPERDVHEWRATFLRSHPRDRRREYSWAAIDRNSSCFSCRFGTLTGIRAIRRSAQFNVLDPIPDIEMGMR